MINKRWNINVLMCEKTDNNVENIINIFDKINLDNDDSANFEIVTIMSSINADEEKMGLYYFFECLDNGSTAFIASSIKVRDKKAKKRKSGSLDCASVPGTSFKTLSMDLQGFTFPCEGSYELQVYKYDGEEANEPEEESQGSEYIKEEHLVATYSFEVCKKKK